MTEVVTGGLLGLALGMRHALEPDHLAAVSTVLADRPHARAATWMGAAWGVGHSLALLIVGGGLLLLRTELPPWLTEVFELGVALMLMVLGARGIARAFRGGRTGAAARAPHAHGPLHHEHDGPAQHLHVWRWTLARRPLIIGLVHGLAGSGALTALAVAAAPGRAAGLAYMALFGLGSVAGMALVTGLSSLPLARLADDARSRARLIGGTGALSLGVGVVWALPLVARLAERV